jgi:two-component system, cell cycle sensor histidine kinase and response regulator CckA
MAPGNGSTDDRLERTLTAAGIGTFEWFPQRDEFRWNRALARILGFEGPSPQRPGDLFQRIVHPDDLPELLAVMERARTEGIAFRHAFRLRRLRTGEVRRVVMRGLHFVGPAGDVEMITGMLADVTVRDELDATLRGSEERHRLVFTHNPVPLGIISAATGRYLMVNAAASRLLGWSEEELLRLGAQDVVLPEDHHVMYQAFDPRVTGLRDVGRIRMRHKDGHAVTVQVTLDQARFGAEDVLIVSAMDVTAQVEVEQALRQSEQRLALALDASTDGIWDWDVPSGALYVSPSWSRMLGYEPHELEPRIETWSALMHPDDLAAASEAYAEHAAGRTSAVEVEFRMRRKDGSWAWILAHSKVVARAADGAPVRVVGTHADITPRHEAELERDRLQAQLQQAQRLEGLGVLAGGIAHDFNNLLVGILGNASLVERDLPPDSPAAPVVSEIRSAAARAADLTRQLLAYAGKGRFVVEPVQLSALAEEMAALLRSVISRRATLRAELGADLPGVEADATQLRQIVMNLITNASDALGDRHGVITVRTGTMDVGVEFLRQAIGAPALSPGPYVFVEVEDNGQGMDAATLARIFDPFFTTKFAGRGLGLAAALGIIRSHRGAIHVRSTPGSGTTVRIVLPALGTRASPAPGTTTVPPDAWHGTGDVLLADDEPTVRIVAKRGLERLGFTVVESHDGQDAVDRVTAEPDRWRLVVLDLTMPRLGGDQALAAIRALRPGLPAVLYSGYSADELDAGLTEREQVTFLQKPFTFGSLTDAVRHVLEARG